MDRVKDVLPRALGGAAIFAVLVAAVTTFAGSGFAQGTGSAAQSNYAPANTSPPAISGAALVGQTLTANPGSWTSQSTPGFSYQWEHCDTNGNACVAIAGATGTTLAVSTDSLNETIRVAVTATNSSGSATATSAQTAVVTQPGPVGAIKLQNGQTSIPASSVALPARLVIDQVQFVPGRLSGRGPFTARFHVSDTRGYVVRDVLVYALGLPYSWASNAPEVSTDVNGWATVTMQPTAALPLHRGAALVVFVRARVQGQDLLAGVSTRRLVQVTVG